MVLLNAGILWQTKTFHNDFRQRPFRGGFLLAAWASHITSILLAIGKIWVYTLPESCKECAEITKCIKWIPASASWSFLSYFSFVLGFVFLLLFAYRNVCTDF